MFIKNKVIRWLVFLLLGIPLGYLFVTATLNVALLALLLLCILYVSIRPFRTSLRMATVVLVLYLALCGLLNFSQPIFADSWSAFAPIVFISLALQAVIVLFAIDGIAGVLDKTKRLSDMTAVVLLWLGSLAVVLGSMAFLHTSDDRAPLIFVVFLVPWLVNGCVFLAAAFLLTLVTARKKGSPTKTTKRANKTNKR